ncbi:MAG: 3-hydroxyacyl-CoA dehydrogenase family protein [Chloroflexota bacterium]|nr:3-hydroxybutyryl-CoA dehydrogenase [Ardenticatenaceae bacterium]
MNILIAGEMPFLQEVGQLCIDAGHNTTLYLVEDLLGAAESSSLMTDLSQVDVAIELHHESTTTKEALLRTLGKTLPPEALVLTSVLNTSTTQAAAWMSDPQRVVGFVVIPPLTAGGMVELAKGLQTDDAALARATTFWQTVGLETAVVADGPGLVRGRAICCIINEAASALMEGVATAADIDKAMQLGTNYPHGPLAWGDQIGLDTVLGVMTGLFAEWGEDRYRPSPLLRRLVIAGKLGQKSGEGFYKY